MKKSNANKAVIAGMILIAIGIYTQTPLIKGFSPSAQAKDGEQDNNESESESESSTSQGNRSDTGKSSGSDEAAKKAEEKAKESAKKAYEIKREAAKKAYEIKKESEKKKTEILRKLSDHKNGMSDDDQDDNSAEDANESEDKDTSERGKHAKERYKHTAQKISEAEKYILEQQSKGKDVTIALERLAQAKSMLNASDMSLADIEGDDDENENDSNDEFDDEDSDDLVKEALKLTHKAQKDDVHVINDVDKSIRKASDRIGKANEKLSRLAAAGGDTAPYQSMIDVATADLKNAKELLLQGTLLKSAALAQKAEGEAKSAKKAIESALLALGADDEELSGDHKSVVGKAVEDLLYVASVEGENGIGKKVRAIARAQRDSADTVDGLIDDAQSRGKFSEFLLGPKYSDLKNITQQVDNNQTRIQSLTQVANDLSDADLKQVVQEHIDALTEENTKLQNFVSGKELKKGLFGWVFRLLQ